MERVFATVYYAAIIAQLIVRFPYERKYRKTPKIDERVTIAERSLFTVMSAEGLLLPAVYGFTPWIGFANYDLSFWSSISVAVIGVVVFSLGIWLFWRAHHDLGSNWSPSLEISAGHHLITDGVYRTVRHPMYAAQVIMSVGQAFLLQNWIAGPAGLVISALLYSIRVPREEQMMTDHFGKEYAEYCRRAGRFFPRVRR